jgi:hypothetical protein
VVPVGVFAAKSCSDGGNNYLQSAYDIFTIIGDFPTIAFALAESYPNKMAWKIAHSLKGGVPAPNTSEAPLMAVTKKTWVAGFAFLFFMLSSQHLRMPWTALSSADAANGGLRWS